jgi:hypothetical protein
MQEMADAVGELLGVLVDHLAQLVDHGRLYCAVNFRELDRSIYRNPMPWPARIASFINVLTRRSARGCLPSHTRANLPSKVASANRPSARWRTNL